MTKTTFQEQQKSNFDLGLHAKNSKIGKFEKSKAYKCNGLELEMATFQTMFSDKKKKFGT